MPACLQFLAAALSQRLSISAGTALDGTDGVAPELADLLESTDLR